MSPIETHITLWWILDELITGCVVMDILTVVDDMVHYHWGDEKLYISVGEDDLCAT